MVLSVPMIHQSKCDSQLLAVEIKMPPLILERSETKAGKFTGEGPIIDEHLTKFPFFEKNQVLFLTLSSESVG